MKSLTLLELYEDWLVFQLVPNWVKYFGIG